MEGSMREEEGEVEESQVFLFPMTLLKVLLGIYVLLWGFWWMQSPWLGNFGGLLVLFFVLGTIVYLLVTPICGAIYLVLKWRETSDRGKESVPAPSRQESFGLNAVCWFVVMWSSFIGVIAAIEGDVAPHLICFRCIEGPDTTYARAGFERLLKRPVPDHVRGVNFQNRNNIMDEHQILRFNTQDEAFIQSLIQEYELESELGGKVWDDKYKPGRPPSYTEVHRLGSFTLYYNRETGDTKFVWFTW